VEIMTSIPSQAKPSNLSRDSVEQIAEAVARQAEYDPAFSLSDLVGVFGGRLTIKDYTDDSEPGSILIKGEQNFEVFLPAHTSPLRDRFTVAHELGHYVLHYLWAKRKDPNIGPVFATRYGSDRAEWEANWFASAFLMPAGEVSSFMDGSRRSVADVAGHFAVSPSAASIRLKRLGLGGDDSRIEVKG
jgi:Zn-dependent peptidase ImmA (M78 family)